jgi:predicted MFS family arabinose efflux permease
LSERTVVFLIGAVQFINIWDFMMVMPLGPDFATDLGIRSSQIGLIGGSYTAAAAIAGFLGSFFLDRFDRRTALAVAMLGLVLGTLAGGLATGLPSLMAARVLAGTFGGPATSLSFSIIADLIPDARRGKAIGSVTMAFSAASIVGTPLSLELARWGGWRLPFFVVGGAGLVVAMLAIVRLPRMRGHLARTGGRAGTFVELFSRPVVFMSYAMTALVMTAGFLVIPSLSPYVLFNLGYPREHFWMLYAVGGGVSFFTLRQMGKLVDRFGSFRIGFFGSLLVSLTLYVGFHREPPLLHPILLFCAFMFSMSFRNVAYNTLASRVPRPFERARFQSLQSCIQHLASALGAFASARILSERPDRSLEGMDDLALIAIGVSLLVPVMLWLVEKRIGRPVPQVAATR